MGPQRAGHSATEELTLLPVIHPLKTTQAPEEWGQALLVTAESTVTTNKEYGFVTFHNNSVCVTLSIIKLGHQTCLCAKRADL